MKYGRRLRRHFLLDKDMDFLNHGSFGAAPRSVLSAQDAWRAEMERQPLEFLDRRLPGLLRRAAERLGRFIGARGQDVAFVDNATAGANAVLRSLPLRRGDEILLASHAYPAVMSAARHVAREAGASIKEAAVPFQPVNASEITRAFERSITKRTRLAVIDHVTSPTALIFPVREIAALCRPRGVKVLIDGAHAPGMLDLDVPSLGADWYVGNCHKWLFAPKGCAFLWASRSGQEGLHPAVLSNNYGKGFTAEFDWCGTKDPSPWLSIRAALDFYGSLGGAALARRNHGLAVAMGQRLSRAWSAPMPAPSLCGSMVSLQLAGQATESRAKRLHDALWRRRVEVPVFCRGGRLFLRISAQAYNEPADYDRLERAFS